MPYLHSMTISMHSHVTVDVRAEDQRGSRSMSVMLLLYPLQVVRLAARGTDPARALFTVLGKFPELQGVLGYWAGRLSGKRRRLIEYK